MNRFLLIKRLSTTNKTFYSTNSAAPVKMFANQPTFSQQSKIPRLPIPTLEETAAKYLLTMQPLLTTEHYERVKGYVADFIKPGGLGSVLQQRLIDYEKKQKHSWLEQMWFDKAYLEYRDPTLINVNWFMAIKDHPKLTREMRQIQGPSDYTDFQVNRAASLIRYILDYNDLINK